MIRPTNVYSITDFQRRAKSHLRRLKRTGDPEVLTVNGEASVVVQDAAAYEELLTEIDRIQALEGIQRGIDSKRDGKSIPLQDFVRRMKKKYGLRVPRG